MAKEKLENSLTGSDTVNDSPTGSSGKKRRSAFDLEEEIWDKKKIIAGILLFLILIGSIIGVKLYVLPKSIARHIPIGPAVEGASTSFISPTPASISLPTTEDLQKKILELQNQITHLNLNDIASSSPQIQQLIQQVQQLPKAPGNAAKEACVQLCNRL